MSDNPRPQVPAADQTLRILSLLARQPGPMAAQSIASSLGIPRSSTYHLLATLEEHGYVVHLPGDRRWGLGTAAFELGGGYARQQPLARLGRPLLAALSDRVGESAHLAVLAGRDVLYIVEERAPGAPRSSPTSVCAFPRTSPRRVGRCSPPSPASKCGRRSRMPRP